MLREADNLFHTKGQGPDGALKKGDVSQYWVGRIGVQMRFTVQQLNHFNLH